MARGKKMEKVLTPEEKLEQALVPIEEQPYPVPENWCWTRLRFIVELYNGDRGANYPSKKDYQLSGIPFINAGAIVDGVLDEKQFNYISEEKYYELHAGKIQQGDILYCLRGSLGKAAIVKQDGKGAISSSLCILRPKSVVLRSYLFYLLCSDIVTRQQETAENGSAQPNLSAASVLAYCIPVPPLIEQQRIINRIESLFAKLDEAKEKVQAVVDGFENRKAMILHKAFTGKLTSLWRKDNFSEAFLLLKQIDEEISKTRKKTIKKVVNVIDENYMKLPNNWLIVDLDRISKKITDGEHKTPNRVNSYCGYYLLSARNIYNDSLQLDDVDYVDESEYGRISKRCNPHKDDVLISCSGSVGRTCVIDDDNNYCMVRSAAMVSISKCNARYVMYAIQSDIVQHQIKRLSKQTAQANLFIGAIAAINIPLPPIEEQIEIVRIIDNIITKEIRTKNIAENILEQIETMKKSILARAFRGELGTNDPSEESAVESLKSIL